MKPTIKVYRKKIIEGYSIPAIIHNGYYYFVDLDVYEDGRVQCWNFKDLEHFEKDVQRGWVVSNIPDKNEISIYSLGAWTIENGNWQFTKDTFIEYVKSLIKELNPNLDNLYKYRQKKINGVTIGENGDGTIYKEHRQSPMDMFPKRIDGEGINLFYKMNDGYHLVKVNIFQDDSLVLSRLEAPVTLTITEFESLISEGIILTDIPIGSKIYIYGLGSFSIQEALDTTSIRDKLLEIKDIQRSLKGEPTSIQFCANAYKEYLDNPTLTNQEKLKIAYENVPDHQKMYVGDMDTKDIPIRMIIYGKQEIEKWSHYQIAKATGEILPSITVPRPKDQE